MKRTYLEEDVELIRRYFPGARSVALRTPFDLTQRSGARRLPQLDTTSYHDDTPHRGLHGGILWMG